MELMYRIPAEVIPDLESVTGDLEMVPDKSSIDNTFNISMEGGKIKYERWTVTEPGFIAG